MPTYKALLNKTGILGPEQGLPISLFNKQSGIVIYTHINTAFSVLKGNTLCLIISFLIMSLVGEVCAQECKCLQRPEEGDRFPWS